VLCLLSVRTHGTPRSGGVVWGIIQALHAGGGTMNTHTSKDRTTDKLYIAASILIIAGYLAYFLLR
jgi:hypothetical protein